MEGQRIYRHCPEHHNSPCYNLTCEHQCFMQEEECRKPESESHPHDKPESEKMLDKLIKRIDAMPQAIHEDRKEYWHIVNKQLEIIGALARAQDRPIEITMIESPQNEEHHRKYPQKTRLVLSGLQYINLTIKNSLIMAISINVQEFVTSTLGLVDHATALPITDASFSNQSYTSDSDGIATVDGSGRVTGINAGTANITFTSDVAYTGKDGQPKTETGKTLVVAVTVTAVPQTTDLTVSFSAPQPVPTA